MAKSMRSKVKRAFRSKKRESGVYAAAEAARLQRLNARLLQITKTGSADLAKETEGEGEEDPVRILDVSKSQTGSIEVDMESPPRPSTHGPRGSRREEWRKSKGMPIRPAVKGMNRQGGIAGRRKAGRSQRRR